jgi:hypothetical protein
MSAKLTTEEVRIILDSFGCTLVGDYIDARTKVRYICNLCNRQSSALVYNLRKRKGGCILCRDDRIHEKNRTPYQEVCQTFLEHNCVLLEEKYVNAVTLMSYRCQCGRESKIRYSDFKRGMRCRDCYLDRMKQHGHWSWHQDREGYKIKCKIRARCYSLLRHVLEKIAKTKEGSTHAVMGYGHQELYEHLTNHPNWKTLEEIQCDWHIDHIFPVKAFLDHGIYDPKIINCLDNLQPLAKSDNLKKNSRYNKEEFLQWLTKQHPIAHPASVCRAGR